MRSQRKENYRCTLYVAVVQTKSCIFVFLSFSPDLHVISRAKDHIPCTIPNDITDDRGVAVSGQDGLSCKVVPVKIKDPELLLHASCDNTAAIARKVASSDNVLVGERGKNITGICIPDLAIEGAMYLCVSKRKRTRDKESGR